MIDSGRRKVGFLVGGCFFLQAMDGTIVTTAAPRLAVAFGVTSASIGLVITSYLVTLAVLIPLTGWLVNRFGNRRLFLAAIVVFTLGSLLCSASTDLNQLVISRVLQGVGGAMMTPVGRLTVLGTAAKSDLLRMINYIVYPALVAPVIAPLAGGLITTYLSWQWMFRINLPLGIIAFLLALRIMPAIRVTQPGPLDRPGVALTALGMGASVYAVSLISYSPTPWVTVAAISAPGFMLLALAIRHLLTARHPLIDLRTLRVPSFRISVSSGALSSMAIAAVPFLLPLLFENAFGWSAVKAGLVVLWLFVGNLGIKPAATFLLSRFGFRSVLAVSTLTLAVSIALFGFLTADASVAMIATLAVISGVARSMSLTTYTALNFFDVPETDTPHANALSSTVQQLSSAAGVAVAAVALRLGDPIGHLIGLVTPTAPYAIAFMAMSMLAIAAMPGVTGLHPMTGRLGLPEPASSKI